MKRLVQRLHFAVAVVIACMGNAAIFAGAHAISSDSKVNLCHATNADNSPYTPISISTSAAGNATHIGPVWDSTLKSQGTTWGDIVPPYTDKQGVSQPGQNWTSYGQSIYTNNCNIPVATSLNAPYATPATCTAAGALIIPATDHISWSGGVNGAGPGTYDLIASADTGYYISGQNEWIITVSPQLSGSDCATPAHITYTLQCAGSFVEVIFTNDGGTGGSASAGSTGVYVGANSTGYAFIPLDSTSQAIFDVTIGTQIDHITYSC